MAKNIKKKVPAVTKAEESERNLIELADTVTTATFVLDQLQLKGLRWHARITVNRTLPKSYYRYFISFNFDNARYEDQIAAIQDQITGILAQPALVNDLQDAQVKRLRGQIDRVTEEWNIKKAECDSIEFLGEVEAIKYKDGDTVLDMRIPDTCINILNDKKHLLTYYLADLDRRA